VPQVELRFHFDLYAGVRPARLIPGVPNCSVARYVARDGKLTPLD